jgi:hypothetical protein
MKTSCCLKPWKSQVLASRNGSLGIAKRPDRLGKSFLKHPQNIHRTLRIKPAALWIMSTEFNWGLCSHSQWTQHPSPGQPESVTVFTKRLKSVSNLKLCLFEISHQPRSSPWHESCTFHGLSLVILVNRRSSMSTKQRLGSMVILSPSLHPTVEVLSSTWHCFMVHSTVDGWVDGWVMVSLQLKSKFSPSVSSLKIWLFGWQPYLAVIKHHGTMGWNQRPFWAHNLMVEGLFRPEPTGGFTSWVHWLGITAIIMPWSLLYKPKISRHI